MPSRRKEDLEAIEGQIGPFGQAKVLSASGGVDLDTTAVMVPVPKGVASIETLPRNFTTATNYYTVALCPYLSIFKTTDDGVSFTEYSEEAQDGDVGTLSLSSLSTLALGDYLYIGAPLPFRAVRVDVDAAHPNATVSVLTVKYYTTAGTWATITATDGTISGGATFAVDGDVSWTVPTDWKTTKIRSQDLYWTRWEVSVALDSDTLVANMWGLSEYSAAPQYPSTYAVFQRVYRGPEGIAALEVLGNANDGFVIVNGYSEVGRRIG